MMEPLSYDLLPLSCLRLLVSPVQLMSAALWGIVQHRAVMHYGLLEDFITAVLDIIPDLLTRSEREQLVLGLRAKVVLEMCRSDELCFRQNIEPYLTRIDDLIKEQNEEEACSSKMTTSVNNFSKVVNTLLDDPYEKAMFYQNTFPSVFGDNFDSALCTLVRKFLMNFEKLLPIPSLDQTSLWLGLSPPVLKECGDILNQPEPLSELIQHHQQDYVFSPEPLVNDIIFSRLSSQQDHLEEREIKTEQLHSSEEDVNPLVAEMTRDGVTSIEVTLDEGDTDTQECFTDVDQMPCGWRNTFRCFVCGQTFCSLIDLKKHIIPRCSADTVVKQETHGWRMNEHLSMTKRSCRIKTCSVCGDAFTSSTDLINHMRGHTEDDSSIWGDCDKDFNNYHNSILHQENGCKTNRKQSMDVDYSQEMQGGHKGIKECVVLLRRLPDNSTPQICTISCENCGQNVFKSGLKTHQRDCFQKRDSKLSPLVTNYVNIVSINPCQLNSLTKSSTETEPHLNQSSVESQNITSSKQGLMKCTLCDKTFSKVLRLKAHYHSLHKIKGPYHCPICKRPFVRLLELVKHHNDQVLYQCNTCKWCFSKPRLRKHIKLFRDTCATPYICEICGKSCMTLSVLKCHKIFHKKTKETTVCSYCGKNFSTKYCLQAHMKRHTGGFPCPVCPKVFYKRVYLNRHMSQHNGVPLPYLCEICGKDLPTKAYLDVHMVKHSQERPFKCDQCDSTYKRSSQLNRHVLTKHSDVKAYVCSVCGAEYRYSGQLKEHMIKHTGIRPHVCSKCGKGFNRKYVLRVHQQTKCVYRCKVKS